MQRKKLAPAIIYHAKKTKWENSYFPGIPDAQSKVCVDPFFENKLRHFVCSRPIFTKTMQATILQLVAF